MGVAIGLSSCPFNSLSGALDDLMSTELSISITAELLDNCNPGGLSKGLCE